MKTLRNENIQTEDHRTPDQKTTGLQLNYKTSVRHNTILVHPQAIDRDRFKTLSTVSGCFK